MRALLDVNVPIALLDVDHLHHRKATDWLAANLDRGWATCPLTENGCIRIMSQASYPNAAAAGVIARVLHDATQSGRHEFWPDELSALEPGALDWAAITGSR